MIRKFLIAMAVAVAATLGVTVVVGPAVAGCVYHDMKCR